MLISNAYAQAAGAADPTGGLMGLLPLILMFVVLWFLMIRPQMKRAKEHKAMVEALAKGDEVVTGGGIAGRVVEVGDSFVQIEVAPNTVVAAHRNAGIPLEDGRLSSWKASISDYKRPKEKMG